VREEIVARLEQELVEAAIAELEETANVTRVEPGQIDPSVIGNVNLLEE
jgi:hypothetical protein